MADLIFRDQVIRPGDKFQMGSGYSFRCDNKEGELWHITYLQGQPMAYPQVKKDILPEEYIRQHCQYLGNEGDIPSTKNLKTSNS